MKKLFFLILLFPTISIGDYKFIEMASDLSLNNTTAFFVDESTIQKDGVIIRFWLKANQVSRNSGNMTRDSVKAFEEVNCQDKSRKILQMTFYDDIDFKGTMLGTSNEQNFTYIPPEAAYMSVIEFVCR